MTAHDHGSATTYQKYRCRCGDCREAATRAVSGYLRKRYAARQLVGGRLIAPLPDEYHGRAHTYVYHGCRCARCTQASTDQRRGVRA